MASLRETPQPSNPKGIVLLIAGGELAEIAASYLAARFGRITVLQEQPESKWSILRRRAKLVGPLYAIGQAACGVLLKGVAKASRARLDEIRAQLVKPSAAAAIDRRQIGSVNSEVCRRALRQLNPKVVAVYGTRIIGKRTLHAIDAPFINYHAGITPKYRGQHPAYWALVGGDRGNAGVTIHLVDEGVDTGQVLYQAPVAMSRRDNITTYQYVQMATALPLFARSIEDALGSRLEPKRVDLPSNKWFPPTLLQYLDNGLRRSIW